MPLISRKANQPSIEPVEICVEERKRLFLTGSALEMFVMKVLKRLMKARCSTSTDFIVGKGKFQVNDVARYFTALHRKKKIVNPHVGRIDEQL